MRIKPTRQKKHVHAPAHLGEVLWSSEFVFQKLMTREDEVH